MFRLSSFPRMASAAASDHVLYNAVCHRFIEDVEKVAA